MAGEVGMGLGLDLSNIEKAAKNADIALNRIIDTGNRLESSLTKNFKNILIDGIYPFVNSLSDAELKLSSIGKIKGVSKTIDDINKLATAFKEVGSGSNYSSIEQAMQSLMDRIKLLSTEIDTFKSLDKKGSNILNVGDYEYIGKVADELNRLMVQYQTLDDTLKQLKKGEQLFKEHQEHMDGASLSAQREKNELDRLNETFRTGTSLLQRQAREEAEKAKEAERAHREKLRMLEEEQRAIDDKTKVMNILSGMEPQSLNNLSFAISKMKEEQKNLDISTAEGVKRYKELGQEIKRCEKQIEQITDKSSILTNTTKQLGGAIAAAFSVKAITGYAIKVAEVRGEFEIQHRAMQVLIGDVHEANKLWNKTVKLAVNSPFRVKELVTYTKQLSAYRIETDKLYDKTKMLSDISAGLGVDMNRLILAYGQVKAANYLRGTELRQFSEAGINILKELSDYFSALEGKAVSVGEVFERVSKRMVSFADVDAVLQKVTSEGGAFYKMQEQQADTLKGMISNLRDSVDLMLDEIGKTNEGLTKGAIKAVKELIENWRFFAELIKQGSIVVGISLLIKAIKPLDNLLISAAIKVDAFAYSGTKLAGSLKGLASSFKLLTKTMLTNPLFIGAAAFTSAISLLSLYRAHRKEISAANKVYESAAANELKRKNTLQDINKEIEANNVIIKTSAKESKEFSSALSSNNKLIDRIKNEYPELTGSITKNTDETTDATVALELYNKQLKENVALQYAARGDFWNDDLTTNYGNVVKELDELDKATTNVKGAIAILSAELEYSFSKGIINEDRYRELSRLADEIYNAKNATEILGLNLEEIGSISRSDWKGLNKAATAASEQLRQMVKELNQVNAEYVKLEKNINNQSSQIKQSVQDINNEFDRGTWINNYLSTFDIIDVRVKEWAKQKLEKIVEVTVLYPEDNEATTELEPWAKRVKDAVEKVNKQIKDKNKDIKDSELFPVPDVGQTKEQYLELAKSYIDIAKKVYAAGQQIEDASLIAQTNALKPFVDEYERILNIEKKSTDKEPKKVLTDRINLIKNLREEYLKLIKTFDDVDSKQRTIDSYRSAFEEAGMNINDVDFTTEQGLISALRGLEDLAAKEGLKAKVALQKAIGDVQVGIDVKSTQEQQKDVIDNIEEMFGNYEISLELDKLNIPPDLAKQLFGVDAISLDDIRSEIEAQLTEARADGGKLDHVKDLEDRLKKVAELEDKQLKERLKTYTEYLTKEQNTRVRMKLEELRKLEEVEELYKQGKYTQEQYATITGNIRREAAAKQAKQTWEDFAKTPYIVQMFDDLDKTSNKSLKLLNDQLQTLKTSLYNAGLPASELKEILDKINQVEKELEARNPFAQLGSGLKDLFTGNIDLTKFRREYDIQIAKQAQADKEHESAVKDLNEYNEKHGEFGGNQAERRKLLDTVERTKQNAEKLRDATQQATENFENARRKVLGMAEGLSTVLGYAQQLGSAFGDMADKLGIMSEEEQAILNNAMSVVGDVANIGMAAAQIAAKPTDPAAWVQGISSVMSLIGNIAATGDAVREKEIQAEMKKVDRLEKAYERFAKEMDEAYTINQMRSNKASMEQNIDAQIKALESANAKEEAMKKKDKDQIDANYEKIAELEEKKAELQIETVERLGGTYDYASVAEQFLDAWLEAFKETGDGLSGLEDNFDEFFSELAKKQLIYGGITELLTPLQTAINNDLADNQQIDDWGALVKEYGNVITNIHNFLTGAVSNLESVGLDIFSGDGSELSGLSKGIQGVSEQTAGVLEAYLNSIRFTVSDSNEQLKAIVTLQSDSEANPVLSALKAQLSVTESIKEAIESVIKPGHSEGGSGVKIFM